MSVEDGFLRVTRGTRIPLAEIELRASRSSGPGGQHANKTESRVEAVFDVEASAALGPNQKRRIAAKLGPVVRAVSQDERSQLRNRELAIERLAERLAGALRIERVETVVAPHDLALLGFLYEVGFTPSQRLPFVRWLD